MLEILLYLVLFNVGSVLVFLWLKGKAKNPYTLVLTAIFLFTLFSLLQDPPSLIGGIASVVSASFFLFVPFLLTILIQKAVKTRRYRLAAFFTRLLDITLLRKPDGTSEALLETALAREGKGEPVIRKVEESIRNSSDPREQYMLFRKLLLLLVAAEKYEKVISLFLENEHPMRPMPGEPFGSSLIEALAEKGRFPEIPDVFMEFERGPACKDEALRVRADHAGLVLLACLGKYHVLKELLSRRSSFAEALPRDMVKKWLQRAKAWQSSPPLRDTHFPPGFVEKVIRRARERSALPRTLSWNPGITPITSMLVLLNLAVFLIAELNGGSTDPNVLFRMGALLSLQNLGKEPWRLITSLFLHFGVLHLTMNLLALILFGRLSEQIFGSLRFMLIYFFSGFSGGIMSLLFMEEGLRVGASGAILGVVGATAMVFSGMGTALPWPKAWRRRIFIGFSLTLVLSVAFGFMFSVVDNMAHVGGALGGCISGFLFKPPFKTPGAYHSRGRR